MNDKSGWLQGIVAVLTLLLVMGGGWVAVNVKQAEVNIQITALKEKVEENAKYSGFLQEQNDSLKERVVINETKLGFLAENFLEMSRSMKDLTKEMKAFRSEMNSWMIEEAKKGGKDG